VRGRIQSSHRFSSGSLGVGLRSVCLGAFPSKAVTSPTASRALQDAGALSRVPRDAARFWSAGTDSEESPLFAWSSRGLTEVDLPWNAPIQSGDFADSVTALQDADANSMAPRDIDWSSHGTCDGSSFASFRETLLGSGATRRGFHSTPQRTQRRAPKKWGNLTADGADNTDPESPFSSPSASSAVQCFGYAAVVLFGAETIERLGSADEYVAV